MKHCARSLANRFNLSNATEVKPICKPLHVDKFNGAIIMGHDHRYRPLGPTEGSVCI